MHNNDSTIARHSNKCPPQNPGKFKRHGDFNSKYPPPAPKLSVQPGTKGQRREMLDQQTIQCCPQVPVFC